MTTIRDVLFGDLIGGQAGADLGRVEEAAERLAGAGAVAVPQRAHAAPLLVARGIMTGVANLLDFELSDVVVGAWRTRSALLKAARETAAKPGTYQQVALKTYTFAFDHECDVDVNLNRSTIATLTFVANVEVEITALAVTVHNGHITKVSGGDGTVNAALRITSPVPKSVDLLRGDRAFALTYELTLAGEGIPLVEPGTRKGEWRNKGT